MVALNHSEMAVTLPSDTEIMLMRTFQAPRQLVFEVHSTPEHIRKWWGCGGSTMSVCEMDFRVGGAWHFVLQTPDGSEHPFKGIYQEIREPERLAYTFIYDVEGIRDFPALETLTFEEHEGRTTLTAVIKHRTPEARDGHLQSGFKQGSAESFNRLDEYLQSLL